MNSQIFVRALLYFDLFFNVSFWQKGENVSNPILFSKKKKSSHSCKNLLKFPLLKLIQVRSTLDKQRAILCVDPELHQCCLADDTNVVCCCRLPWKVAWMLWPIISVYAWQLLSPSQGQFCNQSNKKSAFYD